MLDEITLHKMITYSKFAIFYTTYENFNFLSTFFISSYFIYFFHNEHRQGQNKVAQN